MSSIWQTKNHQATYRVSFLFDKLGSRKIRDKLSLIFVRANKIAGSGPSLERRRRAANEAPFRNRPEVAAKSAPKRCLRLALSEPPFPLEVNRGFDLK